MVPFLSPHEAAIMVSTFESLESFSITPGYPLQDEAGHPAKTFHTFS